MQMLGFIIILVNEDFTASSGLRIGDVHQIQIFTDERQNVATTQKWDQKHSQYHQEGSPLSISDGEHTKSADRATSLLKYLCPTFFYGCHHLRLLCGVKSIPQPRCIS